MHWDQYYVNIFIERNSTSSPFFNIWAQESKRRQRPHWPDLVTIFPSLASPQPLLLLQVRHRRLQHHGPEDRGEQCRVLGSQSRRLPPHRCRRHGQEQLVSPGCPFHFQLAIGRWLKRVDCKYPQWPKHPILTLQMPFHLQLQCSF